MDNIVEARAWYNGALTDVEIGIDETTGLITAVKRNLTGAARKRYRGQLLFPSGVDWHVHFRDPGATHKEDFRTGTIGAALGGVGTVLDMPNTKPVVDRATRLRDKIDQVRAKACIDWGLWTTLGPNSPEPESALAESNGLKLFLAPTTGIASEWDDDALRRVLHLAAAIGRAVAVHAEGAPGKRAEHDGRDHDANRSPRGEVAAIERLARLAPKGATIHVAHATTRQAIDAAQGAGFLAAATPHHLLLSYESHPDGLGKVNPPLRSEAARAELWGLLAEGRIPHLESDHAPHTMAEKRERYQEVPAGVPGVETMLPLLLHAAKRGDAPIGSIIAAACERPAADLGLDRGKIEPGRRADFFLVDPHDIRKVQGERLASRSGWSPFEGRPMLKPHTHYLAGHVVVEQGQFVGRPGSGRRIPPRSAPDHHKS